jgi:hypothetical protein
MDIIVLEEHSFSSPGLAHLDSGNQRMHLKPAGRALGALTVKILAWLVLQNAHLDLFVILKS